jgi:hypothetical protein
LDDDARRDGWSTPAPHCLPRPTWWPAATALGVTLTFWGLVASLFILGVGLSVTLAALAGWVGELRRERARADQRAAEDAV